MMKRPLGFSMLELSMALALGSVGGLVFLQATQMSFKVGAKTKTAADHISMTSMLDGLVVTQAGCSMGLGIRSPGSNSDPSSSEITAAEASSPTVFDIPTTTGAALENTPLPSLADISLGTFAIRTANGNPFASVGNVVGDVKISEISLKFDPVAPTRLISQAIWQVTGKLIVRGAFQSSPKDFYYSKGLSLRLTVIPTRDGDNNVTGYRGKILSCGSVEVLGDGFNLPKVPSACIENDKVALDHNDSGVSQCKAIRCPFGYYISGVDATGGVTCEQLGDCRDGTWVMIYDSAKGVSVPRCKRINCPPGHLPMGFDADGYVTACDLQSNYFITCTPSATWTKATNSSGKKILKRTYTCDNGGDSRKVCIENCAQKVDIVCGWPLNGETYSDSNHPRLTIDCEQAGTCHQGLAVGPDCNVKCSNGTWAGAVEVDSKWYCKKNGTSDCSGYSRYMSTYTPGQTKCSNVTAEMDWNGEDARNDDYYNRWPYRWNWCGGGDKTLFGLPIKPGDCKTQWEKKISFGERTLPSGNYYAGTTLPSAEDMRCITKAKCKLCHWDKNNQTYGFRSANFGDNSFSDDSSSSNCPAPNSCGSWVADCNTTTCSMAMWLDKSNISYTITSYCY